MRGRPPPHARRLQLGIAAYLVFAILALTFMCATIHVKRTQWDIEEEILRKRANHITYGHCQFVDWPAPFVSDQCARHCGPRAVVWRERLLDAAQDNETCLPERIQVPAAPALRSLLSSSSFRATS